MTPNTNQTILQAIPELEADVPADQFMITHFWQPVLWGLLAAIALALLALLLWRKLTRRPQTSPPSPRDIAIDKLSLMEKELPPLRPCSLRLSMILRSFLAGQTQDPALYETHEEFSLRMDSLSTVPEDCQRDARNLLEELAEFKYAPDDQSNPARAMSLIGQTRELIDRIARSQQREEEAKSAAKKLSE